MVFLSSKLVNSFPRNILWNYFLIPTFIVRGTEVLSHLLLRSMHTLLIAAVTVRARLSADSLDGVLTEMKSELSAPGTRPFTHWSVQAPCKQSGSVSAPSWSAFKDNRNLADLRNYYDMTEARRWYKWTWGSSVGCTAFIWTIPYSRWDQRVIQGATTVHALLSQCSSPLVFKV